MPRESERPTSTQVVAEITDRKISYLYALINKLILSFMFFWLIIEFGFASVPKTLVILMVLLATTSLFISLYVVYRSIRLSDIEDLIKSSLSDKIPVLYLVYLLSLFCGAIVSNSLSYEIIILISAYFVRRLAVYMLRQGVSVNTTSLALSADEINEVDWNRFDQAK